MELYCADCGCLVDGGVRIMPCGEADCCCLGLPVREPSEGRRQVMDCSYCGRDGAAVALPSRDDVRLCRDCECRERETTKDPSGGRHASDLTTVPLTSASACTACACSHPDEEPGRRLPGSFRACRSPRARSAAPTHPGSGNLHLPFADEGGRHVEHETAASDRWARDTPSRSPARQLAGEPVRLAQRVLPRVDRDREGDGGGNWTGAHKRHVLERDRAGARRGGPRRQQTAIHRCVGVQPSSRARASPPHDELTKVLCRGKTDCRSALAEPLRCGQSACEMKVQKVVRSRHL